MPKIFVDFLHFNVYDIFFLLQDLSSKLFLEADFILTSHKPHNFTTLELHAISEFLKKPLLDNTESRFDISPVLDLCSQLNAIKVIGGTTPYLRSNIIFNKLPFELSPFKELKKLHMKNVSFKEIFSLGNLRNTIVTLIVIDTDATSISQILQCDVIHKNNIEGSERWIALEDLDLNNNKLTEIDVTISLAPKVKNLQLNDNKISTVSNLSHLPNLSDLSLANNLISECNILHTKFGNVSNLNMSQNNIVTCKGFNRAKHICLDNEKPSQAELDKVSVLRALRIVKEGKTPDLKSSFVL
ncbi:hypothetical protein JTB14_019792 [Gonioctena quinquepunctata]|nr:hypothetical protein JTB14_019792 [Gonioctena quinquepunctata]